MSRWVDFGALKQSIGIEQVLASYRVELQRAGHNQLRGPCPLLLSLLTRPGPLRSSDLAHLRG
jgi:hypothetical protein